MKVLFINRDKAYQGNSVEELFRNIQSSITSLSFDNYYYDNKLSEKENIKKEQPNAVIIHGWFPKGMKQIINYAYKNNIISFCRGDSTLLMTGNPLKKIAKEVYIRSILRKINYFLYVGNENKKYYQHYGIAENKLFPALHCINTPFFQEYFNKTTSSKDTTTINIGFSGKFIQKKQPLLLLEAINLSMHKNKIQLIFIGDGPLRNEMEAYADKNNINYTITGFLNQTEIVTKGYNKIDVLVLPSNQNETWGLVVNEVMTGGIPCIVSDKVGCHSDLIDDGKTGFVFKNGNVSDLTKKIELMVAMFHSSSLIKENVLTKIEKYSLDNTVKNYISAIKTLIQPN